MGVKQKQQQFDMAGTLTRKRLESSHRTRKLAFPRSTVLGKRVPKRPYTL